MSGRGEDPNETPKGPQTVPRIVRRMQELSRDEGTVSMGHLTREIGAQGHAPLLMLVAIFMILPIGMIPGIGGALGIIVALIGVQMLRGRKGLWIPHFVQRREISADRVQRSTRRLQPLTDWIGQHLQPRWESLSAGTASLTIIALLLIASGGSLLVLGAIPIATPLIGLPVAVFALGIVGRDGAVVAAGYVLAVLAALGLWLWRSNGG